MPAKPIEMRLVELARLPRLGWVEEPTPVAPLPLLAGELGLAYLGIKRDDLLPALRGGTKPRKLDYLLATEPWASASRWHTPGAIGSGHVVAVTAAAARRERIVDAHLFWEPASARVLENLAFVASGPTRLHYHGSRTRLGLLRPGLLWRRTLCGGAVIPPGGTTPAAMVGLVRAGLELAAQIRVGALPVPERVYVPCGSGGIAAGLAVGLGMAGVSTVVHAIATVERVFLSRGRLDRLIRAVLRWLADHGVGVVGVAPVPVTIDRSQLGPGYGHESDEGRAACARLLPCDIELEGIYTGKAMAALLADARRGFCGPALFWHTAHTGPLPRDPQWQDRLPTSLQRRLGAATSQGSARRRFVWASAAIGVGAVAWARLGGYPPLPDWSGAVLWPWEAHVIRAASEALLPPAPNAGAFARIAANVDHYLVGMPPLALLEIHGLFAMIEHGTTPLGARLSRFTALPIAARQAFLGRLATRGGVLAQAYKGIRDLCLLGYYQQPATWTALAYEGPRLPEASHPSGPGRAHWAAYEQLKAPPGMLPPGSVE